MLCGYHLDDMEFFTVKQRSIRRFLKQWNSGFEWEDSLLLGIGNAMGRPANERKTSFALMFENMKLHTYELRGGIKAFNMLLWLEAQTLQKPMAELMKKRYTN